MTPEEFAALKTRPVGRCLTCRMKNVEQINKAMEVFSRMKDDRETCQSWRDIHLLYFVKQLKYPYSKTAMMEHMRGCLDL